MCSEDCSCLMQPNIEIMKNRNVEHRKHEEQERVTVPNIVGNAISGFFKSVKTEHRRHEEQEREAEHMKLEEGRKRHTYEYGQLQLGRKPVRSEHEAPKRQAEHEAVRFDQKRRRQTEEDLKSIKLGGIELMDSYTLHKMCLIEGRKSEHLNKACSEISNKLLACSKSFVHVFAAYRHPREHDVIFVIYTKNDFNPDKSKVLFPSPLDTHTVEYHKVGKVNEENKKVMNSREHTYKTFTEKERNIIRLFLKESKDLVKYHKYLNMVSACSVRSEGYGNHNKWNIIPETCIVFFVNVKGLIPLSEDILPKTLHNGKMKIPTDVREGSFELYSAKDYQPKLKMGSLIQSKCMSGTLGAFVDVDLPEGQRVCCITSAHAVLSQSEMKELIQRKNIVQSKTHLKIYQPSCQNKNYQFGHVQQAVYREGDTGVEVVLVYITANERNPEDGRFPDDNNIQKHGFTCDRPMHFASGKIYADIPEGERLSTFFKCGSETGITRGAFYLDTVPVQKVGFTDNGYRLCLNNQILVTSVGEPFADHGDSGGIVLMGHNGDQHDPRAIGLVTGGLNDKTIFVVTPINDILQALGLHPTLKRFQMPSCVCQGACACMNNLGHTSMD